MNVLLVLVYVNSHIIPIYGGLKRHSPYTLCVECVCSNVFTHLWASKFSASEAKVADRVASVGNGVASVTGVDKVKPGDNNTVCEKTLHTSRKSQYLYFYGKPNDLSGLRTPAEVDLKAYNLFLFRVFKDNGFMPLEPVVLDQTSLDEQLSKSLLG